MLFIYTNFKGEWGIAVALMFELETEKIKQPWKTISSVDSKVLKNWDEYRRCAERYYMQSRMKNRIQEHQLQQYIKNNEFVITTAAKHCKDAVSSMLKSVVFIYTTVEGIVLSVTGPKELVTPLNQQYNLGAGSLFTIENAGLNAISISIELKDWVFLSGTEHDFKLFKAWNCFCSPVRQHGEIIGYLDMSFAVKDDHLLMAGLFASTLKSIEERLGKCDQKTLAYGQFQNYRLSPREKEIAYMWLNNCSALRIASELGITEGTVRNVIKKIYRKTEVYDKGQFIRKFF